MTEKKYVFIFLFLSFLKIAAAQSLPAGNPVVLYLSPLALADIYDGPSIRAGGEVPLYKNIAATLEGGYYLQYLKSTKMEPKGFLLRPSVKKYLNGEKNKGKFIALEYQYKKQSYDFNDSIVLEASEYKKQYAMKRIVHAVVVKYGKLVPLGRQWVLEWYVGTGIRHIRSHTDLSPEEEDGIISDGNCPLQEDFIRLTGTRIFPDVRAGIKIGISLQ